MRIKKGDTVKILSGKDRGKGGPVLKVFPKENRVIVEGFNLYKKRSKSKKQGQKGETILVPRPIHASSVMMVCGSCKVASRIGFREESGRKIRYCKKCKATT